MSDPTHHTALPADGVVTGWHTDDGAHLETLQLTWENEAWTARGVVGRERVEYVLRISPMWNVRQFLLFRDQAEPDLWLGTDGRGRWGEMNGATRDDLDGVTDITLDITPFGHTVPIRRLGGLAIGDSAPIVIARVDVETLGIERDVIRYTRIGARRWSDASVEFDVDEFGIPLDVDAQFRRFIDPT